MTASERRVAAGRVGRAHGRDGSFYVERAAHDLAEGTAVVVGGRTARVERRAGSAERPLLRLSGVADRQAAAALRGEALLVSLAQAPLEPGEWLVEDLVGCRVEGLGDVRGVLLGPSCDVLEVGPDRVLVPLVSDAVRRIDPQARVIEVDPAFLALDDDAGAPSGPSRSGARA